MAGSYGVRGWVKVIPGGGAGQGLAAAKRWWVGEREYRVAARMHSGTVVAELEGVASREEALKLKGAQVSIERAALADPGEGHYYHADLVGLEVVNGKGESLGNVKRLFSNGAQDVMELSGDRERLLPWVPAVVKEVDLQKRQVTVEWEADW
ncbi:MAG: 16S rRNA processing protein RimM [Betaproteobacteria bacterium]|nr:16S rRNA processing protein RimM [Betaproteobacteria bacterium]